MKNEQLQAMGVTPWLGDTRSVNKGGKAAKRTLTDLCREARSMRDECNKVLDECWALRDLCKGSQDACKALRDDVCNVLERCIQEREAMEGLYDRLVKMMRRNALFGVCWTSVILVMCVCWWGFS